MRVGTAIMLALAMGTHPALACTGASVHLDGEFKTGNLGWGRTDAQFQVQGREAVFNAQPGTQTARWNTAVTLTDVDVCVTLTPPPTVEDPARTYAGLLFWLTDKDNFYEAVVASNGMFTVARKVGGKMATQSPVAWTKTGSLKTGANERNVLRLTIEGQSVVVRVNDTEVARFRGQAPAEPSHIGLVAASGPTAPETWRMTDLKATNVATPQAPPTAPAAPPPDSAATQQISTGAVAATAGCSDGKILFADSFDTHDPTWGPRDSRLAIADGEAMFTPVPGTRTFRWNRAFVFDDVDACASVRLSGSTSDPTASYAGLIFWVEDDRNYYQAVLAPSGYFTVARVADGDVVAERPVNWKKLDVAKTGGKEKNVLRVTSKGRRVEIWVNGKSVATFEGEPPKRPTYVGMLAASAPGKKSDTWAISDFKVAAPE